MRVRLLLPEGLRRLGQLTAQELQPYPGRVNALLRYLLSCTLVIVIGMTLQVPFVALALVMVFFVTQANSVLTRLAGLMLALSVTLGIGMAILVLKYSIDYPLLRLLASSAVFIVGLFLMRATRLGTLFYIVALMTIFVQSIVDQSTDPETILRLCLWAWMAACTGVLVTLLVNTLLLPNDPRQQLQAQIARQLQRIDAHLSVQLGELASTTMISPLALQKGALTLHKLLKFATLRDPQFLAAEVEHLATISAVDSLFTAAAHLHAAAPANLSPAERAALNWLRQACQAFNRATASRQPLQLPPTNEAAASAWRARADLQAMRNILQTLANTPPATHIPRATREPLWLPDAFSNSDYPRFALKTYLSTMLCYGFYTAVQWPGIHTALITCIVIALPSLGASTHKGLLRIGGCLIGSLLALLATLWVVPHIDSIVGLLLMSLPVIGLGAWIAAGSERSSYAGVQIMFTFALASFSSFAPSIDLTEIRDRVLGILLGVLVSTVIHSLLWPEREGPRLRASLAALLRSLANLSQPRQTALTNPAQPSVEQQRLHSWATLEQCAALQARVALEPNWSHADREQLTLKTQHMLAQAKQVILAASQLQSLLNSQLQPLPESILRPLFDWQTQLAEQLKQLAGGINQATPWQPTAVPISALQHACSRTNSPATQALLTTALELQEHVQRLAAQLH